jgi:hypothetical protein
MFSGVRVLGSVLVRRVIAAMRPSALLAGAQMDPLRTDFHAFLTFAALRVFDTGDINDMSARSFRHGSFPLFVQLLCEVED